MSKIITWQRVDNTVGSYRYEDGPIRAVYADYQYDAETRYQWCVNDTGNKDSYTYANAPDLKTARFHAEEAIRELQKQRGETPAVPECCYVARKTGEWDERAGGALHCPSCGRKTAYFKQN